MSVSPIQDGSGAFGDPDVRRWGRLLRGAMSGLGADHRAFCRSFDELLAFQEWGAHTLRLDPQWSDRQKAIWLHLRDCIDCRAEAEALIAAEAAATPAEALHVSRRVPALAPWLAAAALVLASAAFLWMRARSHADARVLRVAAGSSSWSADDESWLKRHVAGSYARELLARDAGSPQAWDALLARGGTRGASSSFELHRPRRSIAHARPEFSFTAPRAYARVEVVVRELGSPDEIVVTGELDVRPGLNAGIARSSRPLAPGRYAWWLRGADGRLASPVAFEIVEPSRLDPGLSESVDDPRLQRMLGAAILLERGLAEEVLRLLGESSPPHSVGIRAREAYLRAEAHRQLSETEQAERCRLEALELLRVGANGRERARTARLFGGFAALAALLRQSDVADAHAANDRGLALVRKHRFQQAHGAYLQACSGWQPRTAEEWLVWATGRYGVGYCLDALGRTAEARQAYEKALELRMRHADRGAVAGVEQIATAKVAVAVVLRKQQVELDRAAQLSSEAIELRKRVYPPDHWRLSAAFTVHGSVLSALDCHTAALAAFEEALEIAEAGEIRIDSDLDRRAYSEARAVALCGIGTALTELGGDWDRAQTAYEQNVELQVLLHGERSVKSAASLGQLGTGLLQQGNFAEALEKLDSAVTVFEELGVENASFATALGNRTVCYSELGRLDEAYRDAVRAAEVRARVSPRSTRLRHKSENSLGAILDRLGRHEQALTHHEEARRLALELAPESLAPLVTTEANEIFCLNRLGRFAQARELARDLAARLESGEGLTGRGRAHALGSAADALAMCGLLEEALESYRAAVSHLERFYGADHPSLAGPLEALATTCHEAGDLRGALAAVRRAEGIRACGGDSLALARVRVLRLTFLEQDGRAGEADRLRAALGDELAPLVRSDATDRRSLEALNLGWGLSLYHSGDTDKGLACVERALELSEQAGSKNAGYIRARLGWMHLEQAHHETAEHLFRKALEERSAYLDVAAALRPEERVFFLDQRLQGEPFRGLALIAARRGDADAFIDAMETTRARFLEGLRCAVSDRSPQRIEGASSRSLQRVLSPGEGFLFYCLTELESFACFVPQGAAPELHPLRALDGAPLRASEITRAVLRYREDLELEAQLSDLALTRLVRGSAAPLFATLATPVAAACARSGGELFRAFFPSDLWESVGGLDVLHVVPDGRMDAVPLEALVVARSARGNEYVLDVGPPIAYQLSAQQLSEHRTHTTRQRHAGARSLPAARVVALGAPEILPAKSPSPADAFAQTMAALGLGALPGSAREIELLHLARGEHMEVVALSGSAATETALRERAREADFLHISSHEFEVLHDGVPQRVIPLATPRSASPSDDGFLTLAEVFGDRVGGSRPVQLVFLNTCGSSRGRAGRLTSQWSFPLAFQAAGARAVVGSAWPVSDSVAPELAQHFYEHGLSSLLARGEGSLLAAFVESRKRLRAEHPQPFFWGGLQWFGETHAER